LRWRQDDLLDAMHRLRETVRDYYSEKLKRHGAAPRGVDWSSAASQFLRFAQLVKVCDVARPFSLNDLGCGYGALLAYLADRHPSAAVTYRGIDIAPDMIAAARRLWKQMPRAEFAVGSACGDIADYAVTSGVFNVRLGWPVAGWEAYVESVLSDLRASSRVGFGVNFMSPAADAAAGENLYRTEPERWIGFCRDRLGCEVDHIAGYGLPEFTLLVRLRG
jgi:SAM-dependent methyltransferase